MRFGKLSVFARASRWVITHLQLLAVDEHARVSLFTGAELQANNAVPGVSLFAVDTALGLLRVEMDCSASPSIVWASGSQSFVVLQICFFF